MLGLALIWWTALSLIAAALLWMATLILLRLRHQRRQARLGRQRQGLVRAMIAVLGGDAGALQPGRSDPVVLASVLLEMHGLIRGTDQDRVLALLRDLGVASALAARTGAGSVEGRLLCLEALALVGGDVAQRALQRVIDSGRPELRLAVLKALADAGDPISIDQLLDHALCGQLRPSRRFVDLVRQISAGAPLEAATALSRPDLNAHCRLALVDALGASGDYGALPALMTVTQNDDLNVRTAAIRALGRLQHPLGEPALREALADKAWQVRAAAAEAVGMAALPRLTNTVEALLADPEWWVRFRAGEALTRLGDEGLARLQLTATQEHPVARRAAELALAEQTFR